ncbi:MAG: hypothetical protein K2O11_01535 [Oscillospiraceae bacterium]|nr:hypothetical protein [Oscillospiraceae bacterium]
MQPISSLGPGAAQAAGVKEAPAVQRPDSGAPARPQKPMTDEYVLEEKREPSGLYWLEKDENGQPKIYFDAPEQDEGAGSPEPKAADAPKEKASGKKAETCTGSTDKVDREIEKLKKEREQLEQQINSETDETKKEELESKLSQVENELRQKDNDAYRRQHTVFS